jgi:pyrroloquinoline quinone biosynthesis protein D
VSGVLRPREGVLVQEAHGQTVLLRMEDGAYFTLEDVGAEVWRLCDGRHDVEAIVDKLCELFDAPRDVISADVRAFVDDMVGERLLDVGD